MACIYKVWNHMFFVLQNKYGHSNVPPKYSLKTEQLGISDKNNNIKFQNV